MNVVHRVWVTRKARERKAQKFM